MQDTMVRTYRVDDDILDVTYRFDAGCNKYFGEYPDFETAPRRTPNGRPWVNVTAEGCPYAEGEYRDCGSCRYILKEKPKDLIGVCTQKLNQSEIK